MTTTDEYTFKVETIEASQRRKYGDSYFHYIVESKNDLRTIESFCKKVLKQSIPEEQYWEEDKGFCSAHFRSYCTVYSVLHKAKFLSGELNRIEYKVVSPSTH